MYWLAGSFIFRRTESPFHKLDPRVKLLISLEFFALALSSIIAPFALPLAIAFAAQLVVAAIARSLRRITRTLAFSSAFSVFIFLVNVFFGTGLHGSFVYAIRFLAIVGSTSIFFVTTSPDELEQIMKWMRFPRDIVFAFVTAVRFIPVIMLDAFQIMDAQKSRGLELEKGSIIGRIRNLVPIMVPLVVNSVIRSGELAEAMESRAYGATPRPTSLYSLSLKWYDVTVILISAFLFALALYIYVHVRFPF